MTRLSRLAMVLLVAAGAATGQSDSEATRRSLKGLEGVRVLVESLSAEAERDGLNETTIQTDVELKLRQAGIRVLTKETGPYLYISVNASLQTDFRLYAFAISVEFNQSVRLDRDPDVWIPGAVTWRVGGVGSVGQFKLRQLRDSIRDYVDQFINAYLSVNPK